MREGFSRDRRHRGQHSDNLLSNKNIDYAIKWAPDAFSRTSVCSVQHSVDARLQRVAARKFETKMLICVRHLRPICHVSRSLDRRRKRPLARPLPTHPCGRPRMASRSQEVSHEFVSCKSRARRLFRPFNWSDGIAGFRGVGLARGDDCGRHTRTIPGRRTRATKVTVSPATRCTMALRSGTCRAPTRPPTSFRASQRAGRLIRATTSAGSTL